MEGTDLILKWSNSTTLKVECDGTVDGVEREVELKLLDKLRYYDNMYHIWNV